MPNTIDELMFRIDETLGKPWPELNITDKEGLIDYFRSLRYEGRTAPRMKKNMPAPEVRAKLKELGIAKKPEGSGLRRI